MILIIQPIILLVVCITVRFIQFSKFKQPQPKNNNVLTLRRFYCIVGYIALIVFCVLGFFLYFFDGFYAALICVIFALFSSFLVLGYYGYRIEYDEKEIRYRFFFEKSKVISYRNIVKIERGIDLVIRTKCDVLKVSNYLTNIDALYLQLLKKVNISKNATDKFYPKVRKFKDSVYRHGELIFAYCLLITIAIFFDAMLVWALLDEHITTLADIIGAIALLLFINLSVATVVILSVFSAKRAHSSKRWKKIAQLLIKEQYLKH